MRRSFLPELLVIGSETLLEPESSVVFATGTLNVNPICRERRCPLTVHLALNNPSNTKLYFISSQKSILDFTNSKIHSFSYFKSLKSVCFL